MIRSSGSCCWSVNSYSSWDLFFSEIRVGCRGLCRREVEEARSWYEKRRGFAVASSAVGSGAVGSVVSRLGSLTKPKAVDPELLMKGAVFESKLERSLLRIAAQANGARAAKTPFRHCLFVGPPGTGKHCSRNGSPRTRAWTTPS